MQYQRSERRRLSGEAQTDQLFDQQIIERMGRDFYEQGFAPAIQQAVARIVVGADGSLTIEGKTGWAHRGEQQPCSVGAVRRDQLDLNHGAYAVNDRQ